MSPSSSESFAFGQGQRELHKYDNRDFTLSRPTGSSELMRACHLQNGELNAVARGVDVL